MGHDRPHRPDPTAAGPPQTAALDHSAAWHAQGQASRRAPGALLMDLDAFLQHVAAGLGTHGPGGERAVRVVYRALREAVSPGELAKVEGHLPKDVTRFFERVA